MKHIAHMSGWRRLWGTRINDRWKWKGTFGLRHKMWGKPFQYIGWKEGWLPAWFPHPLLTSTLVAWVKRCHDWLSQQVISSDLTRILLRTLHIHVMADTSQAFNVWTQNLNSAPSSSSLSSTSILENSSSMSLFSEASILYGVANTKTYKMNIHITIGKAR